MSGASVLSAGQAAMVLFGTFVGLLIIRVPVAFALGLACLPILLIEPRLSMMMLAQETFNAYNSFILLSVPFSWPSVRRHGRVRAVRNFGPVDDARAALARARAVAGGARLSVGARRRPRHADGRESV